MTFCERLQQFLVEKGAAALKDDAEAQQHLVDCNECFDFLEALEQVDVTLARMPEHDAPDALVQKTLAAVDGATAPEAASPAPKAPLVEAAKPSRFRRVLAWLRQVLGFMWSVLNFAWLRQRLTQRTKSGPAPQTEKPRWRRLLTSPKFLIPATAVPSLLLLVVVVGTATLNAPGSYESYALAPAEPSTGDYADDGVEYKRQSNRPQPAQEKSRAADDRNEVRQKFKEMFDENGGGEGSAILGGGGGGTLSGKLSDVVGTTGTGSESQGLGGLGLRGSGPGSENRGISGIGSAGQLGKSGASDSLRAPASPAQPSAMPIDAPETVERQLAPQRFATSPKAKPKPAPDTARRFAQVPDPEPEPVLRAEPEKPSERARDYDRSEQLKNLLPRGGSKDSIDSVRERISETKTEREKQRKVTKQDAKKKKGKLEIESKPSGATLAFELGADEDEIEEEEWGETDIAKDPERHKGNEAKRGKRDDGDRFGYLAVDAEDAQGAQVLIDGRMAGHAPVVTEVPPGKHRVEVRADGYEHKELSVTVTPDNTRRNPVALNVPMGKKLATGNAQVMGALPKEVIQRVISRSANKVQRVLARAMQSDPNVGGRVTMELIIGANGRVQNAEVADSTVRRPEVERALENVFSKLRFPAPAGGGIVHVRFPLVLGREPSDTPTSDFLAARARIEGVKFKSPDGYWINTYVPGDPAMRLLASRLERADRNMLGSLRLDRAARQYAQPFDAPTTSALDVYLHADKASVQGETRMLVQVGIKGTPRRSRSRPTMNVGVVLDLGGSPATDQANAMRALVTALGEARDIGDRFTLVVAGRPGGVIVPATSFKHGPLTVAMRSLLANESTGQTLTLRQAVESAIGIVVGEDDPTTPLGSSVVLVVTPNHIDGYELRNLTEMAHESAVNGVPVSVVGVGPNVSIDQLDRLTLAGQGNRRLLNTPAEAEGLVDRELSAVSRVIARAVRLRVRLAKGVKLIDVIGSHKLGEERAEQVRQAEQSIDRRMSRNLGLVSDRGEDEAGIQIVIPSYYAGDTHVVLLDVVVPGPGTIADVRVRYKDLVYLKNGVSRANLTLNRSLLRAGPLEHNVLKNYLARRVSTALEQAGELLAAGDARAAQDLLMEQSGLLVGLMREMPALASDRDLMTDIAMLGEYTSILTTVAHGQPRDYVIDSLRYAAFLKILPRPPEN